MKTPGFHNKPTGFGSNEGLSKEMLRFFVLHGANIHHVDKNGRGCLHYAAQNSKCPDEEVIHWLLQQKVNPNSQDSNGDTPLHLFRRKKLTTAQDSWYNVGQILLKYGANGTMLNNKGERPPDITKSYFEHRNISIPMGWDFDYEQDK